MIDRDRPTFHFTPPTAWMNDPNGLVYFDGEYHLFYQHNPESAVWGPMHWGHAVSRNLIDWQHLPVALYPDGQGMIFSGSAVVDWNNTAAFGEKALVAVFTYHKDRLETQNLAYSTDRGRTWTKYAINPVIPNPEHIRDFRDPRVFWHVDHWVMALAAGDRILFYTSSNLRDWDQSGSFGEGYGCTAGVWETPDLFELPVEGGSESRWVLTVSVGHGGPAGGSGTQYFVGKFDGRSFISENAREIVLWMDHGADYYAPQSWNEEPGARRIMLAWMSNWKYSGAIPTGTWRGIYSIPRQLSLVRTGAGIRLLQQPVSELQSLRGRHLHWDTRTVRPHTNLLAGIQGDRLEIIAEFLISQAAGRFGFDLRTGERFRTTIGYKVRERELFVDRTFSGVNDFSDSFAGIHSVSLTPENGMIRLHILLDRSSLEVFANNGLVTLSELIFPPPACRNLKLFAEDTNVLLNSLDIYHLKPARFQIRE